MAKNDSAKKAQESQEITFEKEIARLPQDMKDKLLSKQPIIDKFVKLVNEKSQGKAMGSYITPEISQGPQGQPIPNFDKLILNFLLDDFDKPVQGFDPKLLLGEEFEKYLVEEKKKDEYGQEFSVYKLKEDENVTFEGTSISLLRENCFDSTYDDLKRLGTSFVYEDHRGFISALKSIDIHRNMLLQKFEKYVVVYAGAGSWLRGEKSNDFDVFVVVDDTDVKRMPRLQVKEQLTRIIWQMAQEVAQLTGINLHCQVYLLTDFWDALKDAHPVMFTFLRDGVPFYDRGLYNSWKELLKLGKIRPSPEAIDMHMNVANQLVDRAKKTLAEILMQDVYHAVLNPAQAILMLKGYNPTTPKETVKIFKEVLCEKEGVVSKKDADVLEATVKKFKEIEHDRETVVTGKDVDKMLKDAEKFLKNMKKMFEEITEEKTKDSMSSSYTELLTQMRTLPGFADLTEKKLISSFEKDFIAEGKLAGFVKKSFTHIQKAMKDFDGGKITVTEVNKALKEMRNVQAEIKEYRDSRLLQEASKKKLVLSYEKGKVVELFNFDSKIVMHNLADQKVYELDKKKFVLSEVSVNELGDSSKLTQLQLSTDLLKALKDILGTEEIFF